MQQLTPLLAATRPHLYMRLSAEQEHLSIRLREAELAHSRETGRAAERLDHLQNTLADHEATHTRVLDQLDTWRRRAGQAEAQLAACRQALEEGAGAREETLALRAATEAQHERVVALEEQDAATVRALRAALRPALDAQEGAIGKNRSPAPVGDDLDQQSALELADLTGHLVSPGLVRVGVGVGR